MALLNAMTKIVEELGIPKKDYWVNIYNEYYDDTLKLAHNGEYNFWYTKLNEQLREENRQYLKKKYGESWWETEEREKLFYELEKKGEQEGTEKMDYIKNNYQTDAKLKAIYDNYYSPKIYNIRPISSDKENKKCECEATLSNVGNTEKEVYYTAQKNTDGQIYVELWNF